MVQIFGWSSAEAALETLESLMVFGEPFGQELEGHVPVQLCVSSVGPEAFPLTALIWPNRCPPKKLHFR